MPAGTPESVPQAEAEKTPQVDRTHLATSVFGGLCAFVLFYTICWRFFRHAKGVLDDSDMYDKESILTSEEAHYYSYYKDMVQAPSILSGLGLLAYNDATEAPDVINVLQRFNVYQEVVTAIVYRCMPGFIVGSCPVMWFYFAQQMWWAMGMGMFYTLLCLCTRTHAAGLAGTILFIISFDNMSRVSRAPNQRENWGIPLLFASLLVSTAYIRDGRFEDLTATKDRSSAARKETQLLLISLTVVNSLFILSWQLAHFLMMIISFAWYGTYLLGYISHRRTLLVFRSMACSLVMAIVCHMGGTPFMHINSLLAAALGAGLLIHTAGATVAPKLMHYPRSSRVGPRLLWIVAQLGLFLTLTKLLNKVGLLVHDSGDSDHIFEVLMVNAGLKTTNDFTIKQYTTFPPFMKLTDNFYLAGRNQFVLPLAVYAVGIALVLMLLDVCVVKKEAAAQTQVDASSGEGQEADSDTPAPAATPAVATGEDIPLVQLDEDSEYAFASFCPPDVAFLVQIWIAFCIICSLMLRFLALAGPLCCIIAATLWHSHYLELAFEFATAVPKFVSRLVSVDVKWPAAERDGGRRRSLVVTAIQCVALAALAQAAYDTDGGQSFFTRMSALPNGNGASSVHSISALTRWLHDNAQEYTLHDGSNRSHGVGEAAYRPIVTGDMVSMSIIKASTNGRVRISLHPQYENKRARERDRKANQAFGLRTDTEIHGFATDYFHTDFWVVDRQRCFSSRRQEMVNPEIIKEKGGIRPRVPDWCKSITGRKKMVQNKLPHFDVVYINAYYAVLRVRADAYLREEPEEGSSKRLPWPKLALADDAEAAENLCMMARAEGQAWTHKPPLDAKQKARYYELALKALEKPAKQTGASENIRFGSKCMCEYAFDFDIKGDTKQAEKIYKLVLENSMPQYQEEQCLRYYSEMLMVYGRWPEATNLHRLQSLAHPRGPLQHAQYSYALLTEAARNGDKNNELVGLAVKAAADAVQLVNRNYQVPEKDLAESMCLSAYTAWYADAKSVSSGSIGVPKELMKEAKQYDRENKRNKGTGSECLAGSHYQQPHEQLASNSRFRKDV
jgi:hypothetical protein